MWQPGWWEGIPSGMPHPGGCGLPPGSLVAGLVRLNAHRLQIPEKQGYRFTTNRSSSLPAEDYTNDGDLVEVMHEKALVVYMHVSSESLPSDLRPRPPPQRYIISPHCQHIYAVSSIFTLHPHGRLPPGTGTSPSVKTSYLSYPSHSAT